MDEQSKKLWDRRADSYHCDYVKEHFEGVEFFRPEGTYMLYMNCSKWCQVHGKTVDELQQAGWDVGVAWRDGRQYYSPCHVRVNVAHPISVL